LEAACALCAWTTVIKAATVITRFKATATTWFVCITADITAITTAVAWAIHFHGAFRFKAFYGRRI
jgi:hypothetical protein